MPFAYWVHEMSPFLGPHWGNIGIRYYGLAYLAGFFVSGWLLYRYWQKGRSPFGSPAIMDLMTCIVIGVLLGGRLGYFLLYQLGSLRSDPLVFFRVWEGGMASHGGFIGVLIALLWWARKQRAPFFQVSDLVVSTAPIGIFFGRLANFINGELVGKVTTVPWAVIFPHNELDRALPEALPRHPSQLYQAGLEGLALFLYVQGRFWWSDVARTRPGQLSGEFLIGYALLRMVGEVFREPDASLFFGLSRGTFYSIFLIVAGVVLIARARKRVGIPS